MECHGTKRKRAGAIITLINFPTVQAAPNLRVRHSATILGGSTMDYSLHFGVPRAYPAMISTARAVEETSKSSAPTPPWLPPPSQPLSLNGLRGRLLSTDGNPISLKEVTGDEPGITLDLGIQHHDPGHAHLYNALTEYTTRQCEAVFYCDKRRLVRIEARDSFSAREIDKARKAVDEVRTLVRFIQSIGGGLEHIRALLWDSNQAQFIQDLHYVLGRNSEQPTIRPESVLRLAKAFEVLGRPDLQLALLDHALPQCPAGPGKSKLAEQWIGLATEATGEFEGPPLLLQQAVIAALLTDPYLALDPKSRSALDELANRSVIRKSGVEDLSSLVGSPTSWIETDALSTLTPANKQDERVGIGQWTPLMLACEGGVLRRVEEEVERCMERGDDIDARDFSGATALRFACENDRLDIVRYLLKMGADPNAADNQGRMLLDWAIKKGRTEVAMALGAANATSGVRDATDSRASETALSSPRLSAKTIVVRSKSVGRATVDDLVKACMSDKLDAVQKCIAQRVPINAKDKWGQRPLHYACRYGNDSKIVELLVSRGAKCEAKDEGGNTPLMVACHQKKDKLVETLLRLGADANTTNNLGMTPLMVAAQLGLEDIVGLLVPRGARLEIMCDRGRTALICAAASGHIPIAKFLLDKGAMVDGRGHAGKTPLMHAAEAGQIGMVDLLLSRQADREAKDDAGRTAADHARDKNYPFGKRENPGKSWLKKLFS